MKPGLYVQNRETGAIGCTTAVPQADDSIRSHLNQSGRERVVTDEDLALWEQIPDLTECFRTWRSCCDTTALTGQRLFWRSATSITPDACARRSGRLWRFPVRERSILLSGREVRAVLDGRKTEARMPDRGRGCPFGVPGDKLWVRETFALCDACCPSIVYRADGEIPSTFGCSCCRPVRWRHCARMPRWASRIELIVTSTRTERLRDITPSGASAEGFASRDEFLSLWDGVLGEAGADRLMWVAALVMEVPRG